MYPKKMSLLLLLFILASSLLLFSCVKKDSDRKKELNEILATAQKLNYIQAIQSDWVAKRRDHYKIIYDTAYSYPSDVCHSCTAKELDKTVFVVEGIENISSKIYLKDFVEMMYYDKKEGLLRIWYKDDKGIDFKDGKWKDFIIKNKELVYIN